MSSKAECFFLSGTIATPAVSEGLVMGDVFMEAHNRCIIGDDKKFAGPTLNCTTHHTKPLTGYRAAPFSCFGQAILPGMRADNCAGDGRHPAVVQLSNAGCMERLLDTC